MRIISGRHKSRKILAPKNSDITRPTLDRVKESIFMMLENRNILNGAIVLDLFAGSGALGFESISRGALQCYFVDNDIEANKVIQSNALSLNLFSNSIIRKIDALRFLKHNKQKYDIIFIDPPYKMSDQELYDHIKIIDDSSSLKADGVMVVERGKNSQLDVYLNMSKKLYCDEIKKYGESKVFIIYPCV